MNYCLKGQLEPNLGKLKKVDCTYQESSRNELLALLHSLLALF
jgi:hypothetical protein